MPQSQEDLLQAIAALLQSQPSGTQAMPTAPEDVQRARPEFLESLNRYSSSNPDWLQQPYLGTTPTLDLAGHLNATLAQHYFTGKLDAAQVQGLARHAQSMFNLPGSFTQSVLQTIGHQLNLDAQGNYLNPLPIQEGFRPWDSRQTAPVDVPQG